MKMLVRFPRSDSVEEDEAFSDELSGLCTDALRGAGVGGCDECAVEERHVSAYCTVTNVDRACRAVVAALEAAGLEGMHVGVIPKAPASPHIVWPEHLAGHFLEI